MTKKEILACLQSHRLWSSEKTFRKRFPDQYIEISSIKEFPTNFNFAQKLYHWLHNDLELRLGVCPVCGNRCRFIGVLPGYNVHCCVKCSSTDPVVKEKLKATNLKKYGVENPYQSTEVKEKIKQICLDKYGVEYANQSQQVKDRKKQTCLDRYGVESPQQAYFIKEKTRQTCMEKYGVPVASKSKIVREKMKQTNLERYGVENPMQSKEVRKKFKNTCMRRYNVDNPNKLKSVNEKKIQTCKKHYGVDWPMQVSENLEKREFTYIKKYGVKNPSQSELIKEKKKQTTLNNYGVDHVSHISNIDIDSCTLLDKQKQNIVEYLNNKKSNYESMYADYLAYNLTPHGGVSKTELKLYEFLLKMFSCEDIYTQYSSSEYPFNCDFYIKPIDLYIELNAHWTHGGHPFDCTDANDIKRLESWKSKNTKYYDKAIRVWTVRDVEKRNTAKRNNINYIEIFSNDIDIIKEIITNYITHTRHIV